MAWYKVVMDCSHTLFHGKEACVHIKKIQVTGGIFHLVDDMAIANSYQTRACGITVKYTR